MEAILNSSFDWNGIRQPYMVATENDSLNGAGMLFGHLLTNTAQIFADVRTYWSPGCSQARDRLRVDGPGRRRHDPPDQLRRGRPSMRPVQMSYEGNAGHEALVGDHSRGSRKCLDATTWYPASTGYFRGGGYSSGFLTKAACPSP